MTSRSDKFQEIVNMSWRYTTQGSWGWNLDLPIKVFHKKMKRRQLHTKVLNLKKLHFSCIRWSDLMNDLHPVDALF